MAPVGTAPVFRVSLTPACRVRVSTAATGFGEADRVTEVVSGARPAPTNAIVSNPEGELSVLFVAVSEPVSMPAANGVKLIGSRHVLPAERLATEDSAESCGQPEPPAPASVKCVLTLGLRPVAGTSKAREALPMFSSVTVCEELASPT